MYRPRTYRVLLRVCRAAQPGHHHAALSASRGHARDGSLLALYMLRLLLIDIHGRTRSRTLVSVLCVAFQMAESAVLLSPVPTASTKLGAPASATEPWDVMTAASVTTPPTASPAAVAPTPRWAIVVVMLSVREVESGPLSELVVSVLQIAAVTHALWLPFELTLHSLSSISMGLGAVPDSTFVMETASTNAGRVRPPPAKAAMGGSAFKLHRSVFC